jgi:hypothetical protein
MADLQSTTITGTLSLNGTEITGGKSLKYAEFTASDTFNATAAGITAGGIHQVMCVGGGERGVSSNEGGCGGEVVEEFTTLANTNNVTVTIGAGGTTSDGNDGGDTTFAGSDAGGVDIVALGGAGGGQPDSRLVAGAGAKYGFQQNSATVSISNPAATVYVHPTQVSDPRGGYGWANRYAYAYQSAYAYAYQSAYGYSSGAGDGYKGYGAGGAATNTKGIGTPKTNSGQGSEAGTNAADGYVLVTWVE